MARGLAPVPERNHVVDLMRERNVVLMDTAVFTLSPGSFENLGAECSQDRHAYHRIRPAPLTLTVLVP